LGWNSVSLAFTAREFRDPARLNGSARPRANPLFGQLRLGWPSTKRRPRGLSVPQGRSSKGVRLVVLSSHIHLKRAAVTRS
jgi:hypothetical protein